MAQPTQHTAGLLPVRSLFIASATESLGTAEAIKRELSSYGVVSTVWNRAFQLSRTNVENLETIAASVSGAIFLMGPDDVQISRGRVQFAGRDNVLLELGLFSGKLGRSHCVVVRPRLSEFRWPSDLDGLATVELSKAAFRGAGLGQASAFAGAPAMGREVRKASAELHAHFLRVGTHRWGQVRSDVGYFLRAIRDTYINRLTSQRLRSSYGARGHAMAFRLNMMTPVANNALYIACVDYESLFHEDEFRTPWGEDDGKCGYAWKHGVQAVYASDLDIADAGKAPMNQAKLPAPARNRRSVLSTPVFWRDTPVAILNFDSGHPAAATAVHTDSIRECFLVAANRIATLLHGHR
jgi:predicted nucleotide-binding protein